MNPELITQLTYAGWFFALCQTLVYVGRWYERRKIEAEALTDEP